MSDPVKLILSFIGVIVPPDPAVTDIVTVGDRDQLARAEHAFREMRMWRLKVSGAIFATFLFALWVVYGSGYANEEMVDEKIDKAITPIGKHLERLIARQEALSQLVNDQLAEATATQICRTLLLITREEDRDERRKLRAHADFLQKRYQAYDAQQEPYPEARCDVRG